MFCSGHEGLGKGISVCKQVLAILYRLPVTSETYGVSTMCVDTTAWVLYKGLMAVLI